MTYEESAKAMFSDDYKERFIAEYVQVVTRANRLVEMLVRYRAGADKLGFKLDCPYEELAVQLAYMGDYIITLERRAEIEGIDLSDALELCYNQIATNRLGSMIDHRLKRTAQLWHCAESRTARRN